MSAIPNYIAKKYKIRIMHWDDERGEGNSLILTTAYGWKFDGLEDIHVNGFDTVAAAKEALVATIPCVCEGCTKKLAEIAAANKPAPADPKTEGWTWHIGGRKWHYYRGLKSVCDGMMMFSHPAEGYKLGNNDSPDNCAACRRIILNEMGDTNGNQT